MQTSNENTLVMPNNIISFSYADEYGAEYVYDILTAKKPQQLVNTMGFYCDATKTIYLKFYEYKGSHKAIIANAPIKDQDDFKKVFTFLKKRLTPKDYQFIENHALSVVFRDFQTTQVVKFITPEPRPTTAMPLESSSSDQPSYLARLQGGNPIKLSYTYKHKGNTFRKNILLFFKPDKPFYLKFDMEKNNTTDTYFATNKEQFDALLPNLKSFLNLKKSSPEGEIIEIYNTIGKSKFSEPTHQNNNSNSAVVSTNTQPRSFSDSRIQGHLQALRETIQLQISQNNIEKYYRHNIFKKLSLLHYFTTCMTHIIVNNDSSKDDRILEQLDSLRHFLCANLSILAKASLTSEPRAEELYLILSKAIRLTDISSSSNKTPLTDFFNDAVAREQQNMIQKFAALFPAEVENYYKQIVAITPQNQNSEYMLTDELSWNKQF